MISELFPAVTMQDDGSIILDFNIIDVTHTLDAMELIKTYEQFYHASITKTTENGTLEIQVIINPTTCPSIATQDDTTKLPWQPYESPFSRPTVVD